MESYNVGLARWLVVFHVVALYFCVTEEDFTVQLYQCLSAQQQKDGAVYTLWLS